MCRTTNNTTGDLPKLSPDTIPPEEFQTIPRDHQKTDVREAEDDAAREKAAAEEYTRLRSISESGRFRKSSLRLSAGRQYTTTTHSLLLAQEEWSPTIVAQIGASLL